jgi:protein SCO1/2
LALLAVIAIGWAVMWQQGRLPGAAQGGVSIPGSVQVGGPFTLQGADGKAVSDASFRGRWMLVYFGYTFCPDVCPTELQAVAASLDQLGPLAAKVAPLFITIDPGRDTPTAIGQYTKLFDDRLIGLTGSDKQIADVARAYRVYYARAEAKGSTDYLMDHSSFLYLMGPDGSLRYLFKPGMSGAEMATIMREKMTAS